MRSKESQLGKYARQAAELYNLLKDVSLPAGLKVVAGFEVGLDGCSIGKNFRASSEGGDRWRDLINQRDDKIGWYGYDGDSIGVCFYCGDDESAKRLQKRLEEKFGSQGNCSIRVDAEKTTFTTSVYLPAGDSSGDREWFDNVLGTIGGLLVS